MKWTSLSNGALLKRAATEFDVVLTADQNIEFQQNLTASSLSSPLLPAVLQALNALTPKTLVRVGAYPSP